MVTAGEFCNRRVVTIKRDETLLEAARRMRAHHVGCLVIVEEKLGGAIPIGIVTDRDIVVGVLATASPYLDAIQVGDVTTDVLVVARERESLVDALARMRANGVRRMPVVNDEGVLQGLLAFDDLLEFLTEEMSELSGLVAREQRREAERRV